MDKLILYLIGVFFVISGIDYILGNPLKLGNKFEEGIKTMGALGLGMIGIYSLAPVLSDILSTAIIPISKLFQLDPSIFPAMLFAIDMGGYQMADAIAINQHIGMFSGIIIASTLGATISFTIPVALGIITKEDQRYFAKGVMIGIITIPIGCFIAGLWLHINIILLFRNLIPMFVFASILVIGLLFIPNKLMKGFNVFGKIIMGLSVIGLLLQGIEQVFGFELVTGLEPLSEAMVIVGKIAFILGGAYPMIELVNRLFRTSFEKIGNKCGINSVSIVGILGNLASNLLIFGTYNEMNPKGKIICSAVGVSGAFVFGGQFGFVFGIAPDMISGFIIAKLTAGICSIILANILYEKDVRKAINLS